MLAVRYEDKELILPAGDSLHLSSVLLPVLVGAALASDALYWFTGLVLYVRASEGLLAVGLASGLLAAGEWLIRYIAVASSGIRPSRATWTHVTGKLLALLLTASNLIYRLIESAPSSVVPTGIVLTAIVLSLLIATAYLGKALALAPLPEETWDDGDLF